MLNKGVNIRGVKLNSQGGVAPCAPPCKRPQPNETRCANNDLFGQTMEEVKKNRRRATAFERVGVVKSQPPHAIT
tara:strand:+ start:732 stop:956 length:225 start_codon:yes stop_codon:yes gene_type:complete